MTNVLVKNDSQVENKLVSKPNKYETLAYFMTNNLYVL